MKGCVLKVEDKIIKDLIENSKGNYDCNYDYEIILTAQEKKKCLKEIIRKNKRILYVYEQSFKPNSNYNYKIFVHSLALYVSTSNVLFKGSLVDILVNLCSILQNDFEKKEIKKLVFENINYAKFLLGKVNNLVEEVGEDSGDN